MKNSIKPIIRVFKYSYLLLALAWMSSSLMAHAENVKAASTPPEKIDAAADLRKLADSGGNLKQEAHFDPYRQHRTVD